MDDQRRGFGGPPALPPPPPSGAGGASRAALPPPPPPPPPGGYGSPASGGAGAGAPGAHGYGTAGYTPNGYTPHGYTPTAAQPGGHLPPGWGQTTTPDAAGTAVRRRRTGGGIGAGIAGILAAIAKYGVVILKFGKLGPMFISMLVSLWFMAALFGPAFGAGLLVLIAVHESGHMMFAWAERLPVSAPIFLGPFGALVSTRKPFVDRRQEAVVAIGGPVVGTMGAIVVYLLGMGMTGYGHELLLSLAYFGFFLNLFNLIPFSPLDGGRVAGALTKWANIVGFLVLLALIPVFFLRGTTVNPFLIIILIIGGISTYQRFRRSRLGLEPPPLPSRTRFWIGAAYVAMLAITAIGMTEAHAALQQLHVIDTVS